MTSIPNELIKDPLFQLNALPWLAQPLPDENEISPLLYKQGFTVYAIAPLLGPPPDLRLVAQEARISMQERVRPDVVLTHEGDRKFGFIECKASAFGPTSSPAEQARSLLVVAGPRAAEVLGLSSGQVLASLLGFVMPENDREPLTQTLARLCEELDKNGLPAGQFSILGLVLTDTDISIMINDLGSTFFALSPGANPFMKREPDTDPRPLYFIPYDPDVAQSEQERMLCKRVLFERMQSTIIAAVGRANPPTELSLESQKVLNDAMFGMYGHWENRDSRGTCVGCADSF
ncbi:MAG TPA: hypothetical protein VNM72_11100 [Blastocatellia bacterium]|nr:hypothetical protein [Blastocatellia bacterium]